MRESANKVEHAHNARMIENYSCYRDFFKSEVVSKMNMRSLRSQGLDDKLKSLVSKLMC